MINIAIYRIKVFPVSDNRDNTDFPGNVFIKKKLKADINNNLTSKY